MRPERPDGQALRAVGKGHGVWRIDLLLPFMPRPLRFLADLAALAAIGLFASLVAWRLWVLALQSYELGATTNTYPLTPLWIPQTFVGT